MMQNALPGYIFAIIGYVACVVLAVVRIVGRGQIIRKFGACLVPIPHNQSKLFVVVLLCAPILIGTLFFRNFSFLVNAVIALSGVLIVEISLRDIILRSISGVYDQGISADGKMLYRSDVEFIIERPDSWDGVGDGVLRLSTKAGIVSMKFDSEDARAEAAEIISGWNI